MKTVWKYPLEVSDLQIVTMPEDARIISVQMQAGQLCAWAIVTPEAKLKEKSILIMGTGHLRDLEHWRHVGSVQVGPFVWHVFERSES